MTLFGTAFLAAVLIFSSAFPTLGAELVARIDISSQTMTVSKYGFTFHRWKVSTGRQGFRTPTGKFRPQRTARMWYSRKYENSPMPYSVFFHYGFAIHGTNYIKRLGTPASHGCVRLDPSNAAQFYSMVLNEGRKNVRIIITQ